MLLLLASVLGLHLALRDAGAQTVTQPDTHVSVSEGDSVELRCNYSYGGAIYLFWYVQHRGQGPQLLLKYVSGNTLVQGLYGFEAEFKKSESSFHLRKPSVQLSDAAQYWCALSARSGAAAAKLTFGKGTQLFIQPYIKDPDPAIFQLSSKSNNLSACLFTDYKSNTTLPENAGGDTFISGETVLDMRSMDHKSNGVLAWSTKGNLSCSDVFNNSSLLASSDVPCDAKLVEQSFETDMNLNFQNLSVIGLRVLLLKVVGFNLLMTLRLWSS